MKDHDVRGIYAYEGPEVPLGNMPVTASRMTIDSLKVADNNAGAEGMFTFIDHMEGSSGEDPWVATGTLQGEAFQWTVRRKKPGHHDHCFESQDGEPLFTLLDSVNEAIKSFIANKLDFVIVSLEQHPEIKRLTDKPGTYGGPTYKYVGPCVCTRLEKSNLQTPFDWHVHTNNGQFPKNCFECSCGQRWYRGESETWAHVGDKTTWIMLTSHDGRIVEPIGLDPDSKDVPIVTLLRNIRQRGFIPLM